MMGAVLRASSIPVADNHLSGLTLSDFETFDYNMDLGNVISIGEFGNGSKMEIVLNRDIFHPLRDIFPSVSVIPSQVNFPFKLSFDVQTAWFCAKIVEVSPRWNNTVMMINLASEVLFNQFICDVFELEDCG